MKLSVQKDKSLDNDYVDVKYRELTPVINKILQLCNKSSSVLLCEKDSTTYRVDVNDVLYIEWVDSKSCIYTKDDVYIMPDSLSRLEEVLNNQNFIRISKMALVNIFKIKSVSNRLHYRLTANMVNGEKVNISRHYRRALLDAIQGLAEEVSR